MLIIVNELVKLDVAGALKLDLEDTIFGECVGLDVVGDDTLWEVVFREKIVDVRRGGRKEWTEAIESKVGGGCRGLMVGEDSEGKKEERE